MKDILEHNTRRNQSSETVYNKNEWKNVSSGPLRFVTRDIKSSEIILSNKYKDLINETTFHNHNDSNENNNNIDFSIRGPSVSVKPNKSSVKLPVLAQVAVAVCGCGCGLRFKSSGCGLHLRFETMELIMI